MSDNQKIQEMQSLEQNLQNRLMQKQSFQIELSETQSALNEIENSNEEVYKVIGQIMIKSEKEKLKSELQNKERFLDMRIKSIENQENSLSEKLDSLRNEVMKSENS